MAENEQKVLQLEFTVMNQQIIRMDKLLIQNTDTGVMLHFKFDDRLLLMDEKYVVLSYPPQSNPVSEEFLVPNEGYLSLSDDIVNSMNYFTVEVKGENYQSNSIIVPIKLDIDSIDDSVPDYPSDNPSNPDEGSEIEQLRSEIESLKERVTQLEKLIEKSK